MKFAGLSKIIKYGLPDFLEQGFTGKTKTLPLPKIG